MKKDQIGAILFLVAMLSLVTFLVFREVKRMKTYEETYQLNLTIKKVDSLSNDTASVYQIK